MISWLCLEDDKESNVFAVLRAGASGAEPTIVLIESVTDPQMQVHKINVIVRNLFWS